ncbi:MAG: hypothetical protein V1659_01725 [Candidatus Woesearchaeota archaeon]
MNSIIGGINMTGQTAGQRSLPASSATEHRKRMERLARSLAGSLNLKYMEEPMLRFKPAGGTRGLLVDIRMPAQEQITSGYVVSVQCSPGAVYADSNHRIALVVDMFVKARRYSEAIRALGGRFANTSGNFGDLNLDIITSFYTIAYEHAPESFGEQTVCLYRDIRRLVQALRAVDVEDATSLSYPDPWGI